MAVLSVLVLLSAACRSATSGMPRAYGDVVLAADTLCPVVAGRYFDSSEQITALLALAHIPNAPGTGDRAWIELAGGADTSLSVTVVYRDSTARTGTLRKGSPWSGAYYCEDGWLKVSDRLIPDRWDDEVTDAEFFPRRHAFWVAPTEDGALVARLQFVHFSQFDVWCGDGCRGFPIPGTFRYREAWSVAETYDPDVPTPVARAREADRQRSLDDLARAQRDPVYQEEQLLENGPADPELDIVRKRALLSLVDGMLLRGVSRQQPGFHLSLEFEELYQLEQFLTRLAGSGPVADVHVVPLYRAKSTNGHWTDVVFVRFER